jgi:PAS domain S-box-containing protein
MLGYEPAELIGRTVFAVTPLHEHGRAQGNTAAKVAGEVVSSTFAAEHIAKSGAIVTLEISTQLISSDLGEPLYILGIARDVTARRAAEQAVTASERRYRELFENAIDGISICNLDGRYLDINRSWERSSGYRLDELGGITVWDLLPEEYVGVAKEAQAELLAAVDSEASVSYEVEFVTRGGERHRYEVVQRIIRDDRAAVAIERISRDITERRDLEERLRQSQRLEAVGQLAGGIAHDFNNLLTVIGGNAGNALLGLAEDEPAREDIGEILEASRRAAQLTQQLLAFSRKQLLQPRVIDLNDVVAGIETMLSRLIGETIAYRTVLADGLPRVRADQGQIEQAIVNLVVNARDALPAGGTITVETATVEIADGHAELAPGRYVTITVADDGEGMAPEVRARVFEPFFTTKPAGRGTGLGLSTVLGVVTQSGGQIDVESSQGVGSVFRLTLPVADDDSGGDVTGRTAADVAAVGRGETVLVVEDDPRVRRVIGRILRDSGYRVTEAEDASTALRLISGASTPFALVVSDIVMPGMSGLALADVLESTAPLLPVLLLTGYTEDSELLARTARSRRRMLTKPVTPVQLASAVREVLDTAAPPAGA